MWINLPPFALQHACIDTYTNLFADQLTCNNLADCSMRMPRQNQNKQKQEIVNGQLKSWKARCPTAQVRIVQLCQRRWRRYTSSFAECLEALPLLSCECVRKTMHRMVLGNIRWATYLHVYVCGVVEHVFCFMCRAVVLCVLCCVGHVHDCCVLVYGL